MRGLLTLALIFSMLSCAPEWNSLCRHRAIFSASVMREEFPTRIVTGLNSRGIRHAQTQSYIGGKWEWISSHNDRVFVGVQEQSLSDMYCYSLEEYVKNLSLLFPGEPFTSPAIPGRYGRHTVMEPDRIANVRPDMEAILSKK